MLKTAVCVLCFAFAIPALHAQAIPTATRDLTIQVGAAVSSFSDDYGQGRQKGFTLYADADLKLLGAEVLYRNASIITPFDVGENNFLIGPKVHITRRRFTPYGKALIGIGTFVYQQGYYKASSSQSYLAYSFGGGLDIRATRHINIRAFDYEYQKWPNFPPNGLTPNGYSVGAAYVF